MLHVLHVSIFNINNICLTDNCVNKPLIAADYETPLLSYVPVPELHLLIGIVTHIFKCFESRYGEVAEAWLQNLNIQMSHRAQFNGNGARNLLKNVHKLKELSPGIEKTKYFISF